ncbi:MAG: thiamine pyrophosphate-binding protein [Chitinispirillaceae bacterium]|nr:thiamine pyrophosphate-binding protein [Chitinispirillaceae bacterium]
MEMKVADVIVKCLEAEGIEYAFGISGSHYLAFFHALKKSSIKFISVKHECAAGYMALHYARFAQKPALIMGTAGPGATNLITGIAELYKANLPCFVLTPIVPTNLQGKNAFQDDSGLGNSYSISDLMKCVTKKTITCIYPENICAQIQDLFRSCLNGRKGPVHLLVPTNFFEIKVEYTPSPPSQYRIVNDRIFDPAGAKSIARAMADSKKPLLIVGHRAWYPNAADSIAKLSNDFGIPVVLSASAKGLYDEYAPFFGGIFDLYGHRSAEVLIKKSDCIVSIGEDFGEFATNKFEADLFKGKLYQIDIDGYEIGRNYPVNLGVCGHIGTIIDSLTNELNNAGCIQFFNQSFFNEIRQENAPTTGDASNSSLPLKPQFVLSEISKILPQNSIVIGDIGANGYFSLRNLKTRLSGFSISMQNYTLGQGVAGAIGAKIAVPEKTVISLCGDGAFLMNGMEIATAIQYNIPIIWLIFVNKSYGAVDWAQKLLYNDLYYCTSIKIPDLQKFADSFSIDYYKVTDANSLKNGISNAISNYLSSKKSAICEIIIDPEEMLPLKPHSAKFIKDICNIEEYNTTPYLMKAFKSMLREKV